jgi:hypothetical protein
MSLPHEIIEYIITYLPLSDLKALSNDKEESYIKYMTQAFIQKLEKQAEKLIPFPQIITGTKLDWIHHLNGYTSLSLKNIKVDTVYTQKLWSDIEILIISKGAYSIQIIDENQFSRLGQQELWLKNETIHRINGPAQTMWLKSTFLSPPVIDAQLWFCNGQLTYKIENF